MSDTNEWVEVADKPVTETPEADKTQVEVLKEDEVSQMGPRAQKRIKQLNGRNKDLQAENERLKQEVEAARKAAADAAEKVKGTETSANKVYRDALGNRMAAAKAKWEAAYDAADKEAMFAANEELTDARFEMRALDAWEKGNTAPAPQPQPQQPQQKQLQIAPATKDWMDNNPWFGRGPNADRAATALAVTISDSLVEEGFDPASSDFYEEVEKRLVAEMPRMASKLEREPEPRKPVVVAGQSRTPSRRIRLDEGTVRTAQRLGASLEDTARYSEAIQNAGEGYVTIDVKRGRR